MRYRQAFLASILLAGTARGQTLVDLKTQSKSVDFTGATTTKPFKSGTVLPATCTVGEAFYQNQRARRFEPLHLHRGELVDAADRSPGTHWTVGSAGTRRRAGYFRRTGTSGRTGASGRAGSGWRERLHRTRTKRRDGFAGGSRFEFYQRRLHG
jgi:hypothetical protein